MENNKKPFKTYDELLDIMKSKNLIISNEKESKTFLELYGYYNVVNGYKFPFICRTDTAKEEFIENTTFEHIASLYMFDSYVKQFTLPVLISIESIIKANIAHVFAEEYGEGAYLDINNFNTYNPKSEQKTNSLIIMLTNTISNCEKNSDKRYDCIRHNMNKYNYVPIWVLFTVLQVGSIEKFYDCLKPTLKNKIVTKLNNLFSTNYTIADFKIYMKALVYFRNLCAHDMRLLNIPLRYPLNNTNHILINLSNKNPKGLDLLLIVIYEFLSKNDFINYANIISHGYKKYINSLPSKQRELAINHLSLTPNIIRELAVLKTK